MDSPTEGIIQKMTNDDIMKEERGGVTIIKSTKAAGDVKYLFLFVKYLPGELK